jgi:hypothetical protein
VRDRRGGRQTYYSAQPPGLAPLIDWMSLYGAFWRDRFDRLETLLDRMDQWTCFEKVERLLLSLTPVFRTGLG